MECLLRRLSVFVVKVAFGKDCLEAGLFLKGGAERVDISLERVGVHQC